MKPDKDTSLETYRFTYVAAKENLEEYKIYVGFNFPLETYI